MGRITLRIVRGDGRANACTGSFGALTFFLQPVRGAWTTPTEAILRIIFASSRTPKLAREPMPSCTSCSIVNTNSWLVYRIPPAPPFRFSKEPLQVARTSSKAIRNPVDVACTSCTGRRVPSSPTDTGLSALAFARSAVFLQASADLTKS